MPSPISGRSLFRRGASRCRATCSPPRDPPGGTPGARRGDAPAPGRTPRRPSNRLFGDRLELSDRLPAVRLDRDFPHFVDLAGAAERQPGELLRQIAPAYLLRHRPVPDFENAALGDVAQNLLSAVIDAAEHQITVEHDVSLLEQAGAGRVIPHRSGLAERLGVADVAAPVFERRVLRGDAPPPP